MQLADYKEFYRGKAILVTGEAGVELHPGGVTVRPHSALVNTLMGAQVLISVAGGL